MMFTRLEKFLFDNFNKMPGWVRVITYLFILVLFAYLVLSPRFISGRLVGKGRHGGELPYRGVEIQRSVNGHNFKFYSNEEGYWSLPIMSLLPHNVSIYVHHPDVSEYFKVELKVTDLWKHWMQKDEFRVEISNNPASVKIASNDHNSVTAGKIFAALLKLFHLRDSTALAGELILPPNMLETNISPEEMSRIQVEIFNLVSAVLEIPSSEINEGFPLIGEHAPTYIQRIEIIKVLENRFGFIVPDEHWKQLGTVGELVDYVQKRRALQEYLERQSPENPSRNWLEIQQNLPDNMRPVFKQ